MYALRSSSPSNEALPLVNRVLTPKAPAAPTLYQVNKAREALTVWVLRKAAKVARDVGFGYVAVDTGNPETYEGVLDAFKVAQMTRQAFPVWAGASDATIYTNAEANHAFRYIHDVYHATMKQDFTTAGELQVAFRHVKEVSEAFGADSIEAQLMWCDSVGQVMHYANTGEFIADQLDYAMQRIAQSIIPTVSTVAH